MTTNAYSIFDEKAVAYGVPFFMASNGLAIRAFADLVDDNRSSVNKHPGDYRLYKIGTYNDVTGVLTSIIPEFISHALDFANKSAVQNDELNNNKQG